jgi:1,4-alpha-glucan branching enzyme
MGAEFGQISEWYCKVSLDWHLTEQNTMHQQLQKFVQQLNAVYKDTRPLWEIDFSHEGFRWIDFKDVDNSIIAFCRQGKEPQDHVVCLLNFTPQVLHDYKLGVPAAGWYQEILSTDITEFGGSNVCNPDRKQAIAEPHGEAPFHIRISVPPLGGVMVKPV